MHNPIKLGLKNRNFSPKSWLAGSLTCPPAGLKARLPVPRGKHLGKIGGQDQWPFLRILKRKPLTILARLKGERFPEKNRLEIKEIPFFRPKGAAGK
jgi:hypothetical protein